MIIDELPEPTPVSKPSESKTSTSKPNNKVPFQVPSHVKQGINKFIYYYYKFK